MDRDDGSVNSAVGSAAELDGTDVLRHLPEITVLVVDHDLRYLGAGGAGGAGSEADGWEAAEVIGRTLHDVASPAEIAVLEGAYRSALAGEVSRVTLRGERRCDRLHEIEVVPVRDAAGTITSAMAIARDLSELVAHERAAADAEQRLRALVDSSGDMLALYDLDGFYLEVSSAARDLFGWEPSELVGTNAYDLFHPDDVERIAATHAEVLGAGQVGPIEYRFRCRDGSYRWVEAVGRSLHDPASGAPTAIQCSTRGISRRRVAEEALRASEARFRTAMLHAPVGMALVAMDGTFLEVNAALGAILGREPAELVGTPYQELLEGSTLDLDPGTIPSIDTLDEQATVIALGLRRGDGSEVEVDLHVAIVRSPGGTPLSAVVQVVDTTAARHAAAELRRANEELERFASIASHDLRSPLATTRGLLALLERQLPASEDTSARDLLQRAQRQLERLSETVDAVLELTRAGSEPLELSDVAAATLLAEVADSLGPLAERSGSRIELEADAVLTGDPRLLHSLLQNLVGNALRSTDGDRPVHVGVAAARDERTWTLHVTDDGDGFPAHLRDRVFEPFAHHDRPGQPPGHGLGLAICARIVARHGGTISIDHLEHGTRVRILVPTTLPTEAGHGPDAGR